MGSTGRPVLPGPLFFNIGYYSTIAKKKEIIKQGSYSQPRATGRRPYLVPNVEQENIRIKPGILHPQPPL